MNTYLPYPLRKDAVRVNWVNTYRIIWKVKDLFYRKARDYKEYRIHFIFQKRNFLISYFINSKQLNIPHLSYIVLTCKVRIHEPESLLTPLSAWHLNWQKQSNSNTTDAVKTKKWNFIYVHIYTTTLSLCPSLPFPLPMSSSPFSSRSASLFPSCP